LILHEAEGRILQLFDAVRDEVEGACAYCANAYQVKDDVAESGIDLLDDYDGHPSVRRLVSEGYEVLTF